jgi:hypothetical protein
MLEALAQRPNGIILLTLVLIIRPSLMIGVANVQSLSLGAQQRTASQIASFDFPSNLDVDEERILNTYWPTDSVPDKLLASPRN